MWKISQKDISQDNKHEPHIDSQASKSDRDQCIDPAEFRPEHEKDEERNSECRCKKAIDFLEDVHLVTVMLEVVGRYGGSQVSKVRY